MDRRHVPNRRQKVLLISLGYPKTATRRLITIAQLQHVHRQAHGPGALLVCCLALTDHQSYHQAADW